MDLQEFGRKLETYRLESPEVRDARLQEDCQSLIKTLDSLLPNLREPMKSSRLSDCLECCKEILVEMLDFLTSHYGNSIVEPQLHKICELRDTVRDLQSMATRGFWGRLFYANSSHDDLRRQATRQVSIDFVNVYRSLLAQVDEQFHTVEIRNEWRSECRAFLEDFRQRW
jgi:hypothetical protein